MTSGAGYRTKDFPSEGETAARRELVDAFRACPIPQGELLQNLGLFINRQSLTRILYLTELYRRIVPVPGVVMELGVRWGQTLALWESLRGIYEPYNHTRRIIGFDTFAGFPRAHERDGEDDVATAGAYGVSPGYEDYLAGILEYHERESPISHIRKFELVKGDASQTLPRYLAEHPETIVALAYFDFDLYESTKVCLEAIAPCLTKGSVVAFDELNCRHFPGETLALKETLGLGNVRLRRSRYDSYPAYLVVE